MPTRNLSGTVWTQLIRKVILHPQDQRGVASIRYRNRAEITVLVCEQKPYPEWCLRAGASWAIPYSVNAALHDWFIWFLRLILSNASRTEIAWSS